MKLHFFDKRFFLIFFFSSIFFLLSSSTQAQSKNGIFLEGGGAVPYYSVNYTRQLFTSEKTKAYARIGGSVWESGVAFPVGLSLLFGSSDHHPTISFMVTPKSEGTRFWDREESDIFLDIVVGIEYRYQPVGNSFFVNAGLYPYLGLDPTTDNISEAGVDLNFRIGGGVGWFF